MELYAIFGIIGNILSFYFATSITQSYIANRIEQSDQFNEYLFFIMFFSSCNWLYYSIMLKDIFIFFNNVLFIHTNLGMMMLGYKNINLEKKLWIELITVTSIFYLLVITFLINFTSVDYSKLLFTEGIVCTIYSLSCYIAPILVIKDVIQNKNYKLIYLPQILIGLVFAIIFIIYGILIYNIFIIIVNCFIILICFIQLAIYSFFKYNYYDNIDNNKNNNNNNTLEQVDEEININNTNNIDNINNIEITSNSDNEINIINTNN